MSSRLTAVQRDVIERLKDGWKYHPSGAIHFCLTKEGEAPRHVKSVTHWSLVERGLLRFVRPLGKGGDWVLVDGADA